MRVKFWGVRGSIPSPECGARDLRWKLETVLKAAEGRFPSGPEEMEAFFGALPEHLLQPVGNNTSCVEVTHGDERIVLDAGSGLRCLGRELNPEEFDFDQLELFIPLEKGQKPTLPEIKAREREPLDLTILMSHTHWDHIQGFPFFSPAYVQGTRLRLYGRDGDQLAWAFDRQQSAPTMFPIPLSGMAADISFHTFPAEGLRVGGVQIDTLALPHPGGCQAFRLTAGGRSLVYATDYEFPDIEDDQAMRFVEFIREADVLISDTQYTYMEGVAREGWGHSTSFGAMDLALQADVRRFFLFHHDPEHSDAKLLDNLDKTRAYHQMMSDQGDMLIDLAMEGLTVDL